MDPFDYKNFLKTIGNTCEGYSPDVNNLGVDDMYITYRATRDAYRKAIEEYLLTVFKIKYFDENNTFCTGCISQVNYGKLIDKVQGPNGVMTYFDEVFGDVSRRFWNSLYAAGDPNKLSGTVTYNETRKLFYPSGQVVPYTLVVDYTNAQVPSKALYKEYRTKLGVFLQKLKEFHYMSMKMSFSVFTPPV
jgi:hypothetical protein